MSKHYNYPKAKAICEERKPITATLGMLEDWSWTAEEVWKDGNFLVPTDDTKYKIGGISSSNWATPSLLLDFGNGEEVMVVCFIDDKQIDEEAARNGRLFASFSKGVISGPCQQRIDQITVEK